MSNISIFINSFSGQVEKRLTDGTVEISFPNGSSRKIFPDGLEEWTFSDKSVLKTNKKTGYRMLELPNGQKEIHTSEYKVILFVLCITKPYRS